VVGVILSAVFFAWKVGQLFQISSSASENGNARVYTIEGQVFFASAEDFINAFDYGEAIDTVVIDASRAHFWDITSVASLDKVIIKFRREGTHVDLIGTNDASASMIEKLAIHDKIDLATYAPGH
jgi:SulP family sulfate permease